MKILIESHVLESIATKDLKNIVSNTATNTIIFTEDELTVEETRHTKPLHIPVERRGIFVARILIDNGLALRLPFYDPGKNQDWGRLSIS